MLKKKSCEMIFRLIANFLMTFIYNSSGKTKSLLLLLSQWYFSVFDLNFFLYELYIKSLNTFNLLTLNAVTPFYGMQFIILLWSYKTLILFIMRLKQPWMHSINEFVFCSLVYVEECQRWLVPFTIFYFHSHLNT